MIRKRHDSLVGSMRYVKGHFTVKLHYDGGDGAGNHPFISTIGLLVPQNLRAMRARQVLVLRARWQFCGPLG